MKVVIVGSGRTGRGFIAPFFFQNNDEVIFVDKDEDLIDKLNAEKVYDVYSFTTDDVFNVNNYSAYKNEQSVEQIAEADVVVTSVFADNLEDLAPLFIKSIAKREKDEKLLIICAENGVDVKKKLIDCDIDADITEAAIFCTSVNTGEGLDITSEKDITLFINDYFDHEVDIKVPGIQFTNTFDDLIQRKIYTYNFLSAVLAYYGFYNHHDNLADSYDDPEIRQFIDKYMDAHNEMIAEKYNTEISVQKDFSNKAINKFSNHQINDGIQRNAQQVKRKLKINERLIYPLNLALEKSKIELIDFYTKVIALAIYYGVDNNELEVGEYFELLEANIKDSKTIDKIKDEYEAL